MVQSLMVLALSTLLCHIFAENPAVCQQSGVALLQLGTKINAISDVTWASVEPDKMLKEQHSSVIHATPNVAFIGTGSASNGTEDTKSSSISLAEPVCEDYPLNWTSAEGTPCWKYNKSDTSHNHGAKWCEGGKPSRVLQKWLKLYADKNGVAATHACCVCGGGRVIGLDGKVVDDEASAKSENTSAVKQSNGTTEVKDLYKDVLKHPHFFLKDLPQHSKMQHAIKATETRPQARKGSERERGACSTVLVPLVPMLFLVVSLLE